MSTSLSVPFEMDGLDAIKKPNEKKNAITNEKKTINKMQSSKGLYVVSVCLSVCLFCLSLTAIECDNVASLTTGSKAEGTVYQMLLPSSTLQRSEERRGS